MFEIGFPELVLIAIVGLLVIGPERLPEALRTLGLWFGRMRRSFTTVKAEIEKEIGMDEVKRQLHNEAILEEMKRIEAEVKNTADSARSSLNAGVQAAQSSAGPAQGNPAGTTPSAELPATNGDATAAATAAAATGPAGEPGGDQTHLAADDDDRSHADAAADDRDQGDAAADDRDHSDAGTAQSAAPARRKTLTDDVDALDYAIGDISPPPPPAGAPADGDAGQDPQADPNQPSERMTNG